MQIQLNQTTIWLHKQNGSNRKIKRYTNWFHIG